jgi:hypothetical protein
LMRVVWSEFTTPSLPRRSKPPPEKFVEEINFAKREMNWLWMIDAVSEEGCRVKYIAAAPERGAVVGRRRGLWSLWSGNVRAVVHRNVVVGKRSASRTLLRRRGGKCLPAPPKKKEIKRFGNKFSPFATAASQKQV